MVQDDGRTESADDWGFSRSIGGEERTIGVGATMFQLERSLNHEEEY